jgi:hypothetical protein
MGYEDKSWNNMAHDWVLLQAFENKAMDLQIL